MHLLSSVSLAGVCGLVCGGVRVRVSYIEIVDGGMEGVTGLPLTAPARLMKLVCRHDTWRALICGIVAGTQGPG